jgi:tetratricopeptide (TPR) repeat protein
MPAPETSAQKRRTESQYQAAVKNFETAVRYLHKQNYDKAKEILEKVAEARVPEIAERARVHLRLCEQKLQATAPAPKDAEYSYNLGVAALNARNLELAIEHLGRADKIKPNQEHIRYALAAAHARQGNADTALEHLKASITLRPGNRSQARHDEDFASLVGDQRFKRLLSSEGSHSS